MPRRKKVVEQGLEPRKKFERFTRRGGSLGAGFTFVPVPELWMQFRRVPISLPNFYKWLKVLKVPVISMGQERLVRVQTFKLALLAVSRVGARDFTVPGSSHPRDGGAEELKVEEFRGQIKELLLELMLCQSQAGQQVVKEVVEEMNEVMGRFIEGAIRNTPMQVSEAQKRELEAKVQEYADVKRWLKLE